MLHSGWWVRIHTCNAGETEFDLGFGEDPWKGNVAAHLSILAPENPMGRGTPYTKWTQLK